MTFYECDSSSGMTGMGIKTDSKVLLKLGNNTGVNNDSGFELDHKFEDQSHIPHWVQFHKKWELANLLMGLSKVWNWSSSIWWS